MRETGSSSSLKKRIKPLIYRVGAILWLSLFCDVIGMGDLLDISANNLFR